MATADAFDGRLNDAISLTGSWLKAVDLRKYFVFRFVPVRRYSETGR